MSGDCLQTSTSHSPLVHLRGARGECLTARRRRPTAATDDNVSAHRRRSRSGHTSSSWTTLLLLLLLVSEPCTAMARRRRATACRRESARDVLHTKRQFDPGGASTTFNADRRCLVLCEETIRETCAMKPARRHIQYRSIYFLLPNDASTSRDRWSPCALPFNLYDMFMLRVLTMTTSDIRTALGDSRRTQWLSDDAKMCVNGDQRQCTNCLRRVESLQASVAAEYSEFTDLVMTSVNCQPTADPRFTSNSSCTDCLTWYQKWLLATPSKHEMHVSNLPPCAEWCHYAELACPFFNRFDDDAYAGLPAFRCEDSNIARPLDECACLHPCDMDAEPGSAGVRSTTNAHIMGMLDCPRRDRHLKHVCGRQHKPPVSTTNSSSPSSSEWHMTFLLLVAWCIWSTLPD